MRPRRLSASSAPSASSLYVNRLSSLIPGLLLVVLAAGLAKCALAEDKVTIEQMPPAVREGSAQLTGHYNPAQTLRLVFALKPPHLQEEEEFLRQIQDPDSPQFHQYLSQEQWNQRFAPAAEDEQAVVTWAQSQGFTITQRYANRLLVDVEAPSAVIERALDVSINTYQLAGESYFSNDRDPSLPAHLVGTVHSVMGLNNIQRVHSFLNMQSTLRPPDYSPGPAYADGPSQRGAASRGKAPTAKPTQASGIRPAGYDVYTPNDINNSQAYDYVALHSVGACCNPTHQVGGPGPLTSIAIAIWGDYNDSDLNGFVQQFYPMTYNVQRHFVDGTPQCCNDETALDVEWATAMSNSWDDNPDDTAKIHVYEGSSDTMAIVLDVLNHALDGGEARVLNMSWGGAENYAFSVSDMDSFHSVFNQLVGQGWTLVAASGDGGATTSCVSRLAVSYPATDPDVVAVGGTTLVLNQGPTYSIETGWSGSTQGCSNNDGGSGGGCSAQFAAPWYQVSPACGSGSRSVPDIALNSDWVNTPQEFIFNGYFYAAGGTSIAAPEMSGFFAQENAYLLYIQSLVGLSCGASLNAPCSPLGAANPYIYYEGNHPGFAHYPFYDITYGCNSNDITQQYHLTPYCSRHGYDRVTGWGSVNMLQFAWMLNDFFAGDGAGPDIQISGPPVNHWYNSDQTVSWTLADTSGNGHPPIGAAGSSMNWDADPGDPQSQSSPGTGSSFYGPQFSGSSGSANGLGNLSQGCHTAFVRGWDNGGASQVSTYGPLCYDTIPPVTNVPLSGNNQGGDNYIGPVQVSVTATDSGSGVASIMYQRDSGNWQSYTGPYFEYEPGPHATFAYSTDAAGNVSALSLGYFIIVSNTQYLLTIHRPGAGRGTVTSMDGIINCGTYCSHHYYDEQPVTLTATPNPGSVFGGWSGCDLSDGLSCTLTMTADRVVYATFNLPTATQFIPVPSCRVADTRWPTGDFGGPSLQAQVARSFVIPSSACNIPATATAYALNVTALPHNFLGYLTVWPTGQDRPTISTLNSWDGRAKANAAIVSAGTNGAINLFATNTSDAVLDITGYFVPLPNPSALAYYPVTPCRISDTRWPTEPLGGPSLTANLPRDLPILSSSCGIPDTAQAYSLNVTAVPQNGNPVWVVNAWPAGQDEPATSILNAVTGTVVANAAIVSAGTGGDINVVASSNSDLVIDVDGYFAPPGTGGLSFYSSVPCRVLDTRQGNGAFNGLLVVNVVGASCDVPATAQSYALNASAIPGDPLWVLMLYPDGGLQPTVSTLNAYDGALTSNLAIVGSTNGSIDAYTYGLTNLLLDITGYFAP